MPPMLNRYNDSLIDTLRYVPILSFTMDFERYFNDSRFFIVDRKRVKILQNLKPSKCFG